MNVSSRFDPAFHNELVDELLGKNYVFALHEMLIPLARTRDYIEGSEDDRQMMTETIL